MTSPITLLAPAAASDTPAPEVQDPAAFAAALLAASLLTLPVAAPVAQPAPAGTAADAEAPAEAETAEDPAAALQSPVAVVEAGALTGTPEADTEAETTNTGGTAPSPALGSGKGAGHRSARSGRIGLDLVSDEAARPERVARAAQAKAQVEVAASAAPGIVPAGSAGVESTPGSCERQGQATQTEPSPPPDQVDCAVTQAQVPNPPVAPSITPGSTASTGGSTPQVGKGKERRSRSQHDASREAARPDATPMPVPPAVAAVLGLPRPEPAAAPAATSESDGTPRRAPDPAPVPAAESGVGDAGTGTRAMVENARLGRQLAELLGDVDVTEFKVTLAARPSQRTRPGALAMGMALEGEGEDVPASPGAPATAAGALRATPEMRATTAMLGDVAAPMASEPPALPGQHVDVASDPTPSFRDAGHTGTASVPAALSASPRLADAARALLARITDRLPAARGGRQEVTAEAGNRPAIPARVAAADAGKAAAAPGPVTAMEASAPLPIETRTDRAATPGPTLPPARQELPDAAAPPPPAPGEGPIPARRANKPTSDAAASASVAAGGPMDRLTERESAAPFRVAGEARNLPHEDLTSEKPAGVADRVSLQVADADGRQTRIRVAVLGDQVRAVIVPPDPESARQLERRMDELQDALIRQGFTSARVSVQQAGEAAIERGGTAGLAVSTPGDTRAAVSPGRDQPAGDQRQGRGQRDQERAGDGQRHPNGQRRERDPEHRRR